MDMHDPHFESSSSTSLSLLGGRGKRAHPQNTMMLVGSPAGHPQQPQQQERHPLVPCYNNSTTHVVITPSWQEQQYQQQPQGDDNVGCDNMDIVCSPPTKRLKTFHRSDGSNDDGASSLFHNQRRVLEYPTPEHTLDNKGGPSSTSRDDATMEVVFDDQPEQAHPPVAVMPWWKQQPRPRNSSSIDNNSASTTSTTHHHHHQQQQGECVQGGVVVTCHICQNNFQLPPPPTTTSPSGVPKNIMPKNSLLNYFSYKSSSAQTMDLDQPAEHEESTAMTRTTTATTTTNSKPVPSRQAGDDEAAIGATSSLSSSSSSSRRCCRCACCERYTCSNCRHECTICKQSFCSFCTTTREYHNGTEGMYCLGCD